MDDMLAWKGTNAGKTIWQLQCRFFHGDFVNSHCKNLLHAIKMVWVRWSDVFHFVSITFFYLTLP